MSSLVSRLLHHSPTRPAGTAQRLEATLYKGDETLEVVGESFHQDTLWALVGGRRSEYVRCDKIAVLIPDPENEYDEDAIEVRIDGQLVGNLSQQDAARYYRGLIQLMEQSRNRFVALEATIAGGGLREDGLGYLGVFLNHDPADFGLQRGTSRVGGFRTGFSEASATDLADDRYDLSWSWNLSADDATAAAELSQLLASVHDPIDRHYIYSELEHRLYRCRNTLATALDDFDSICRAHDDEMDEIRPVLLDKFGVVPVIDMYRQATIRCAKAKRWQESREWAERGIRVYSDDAARPEVVADLRERAAHAAAKTELTDRPASSARATRSIAMTKEASETETLVCAACGANFERTRVRGRKPRLCPRCRNSLAPTGN